MFPKSTSPYFELLPVGAQSSEAGHGPDREKEQYLGKYEYYRNTGISLKKQQNREDQKKRIDAFHCICWILAAIVLILAALVHFEKLEINQTTGYMGLIFIVLVLAPSVQKIKFFGLEINQFDRKVTEEDDNR